MDICIDHATKYIRHALILNDVTLNLNSGRIYGLQGPNGSGKTMLLRLIAGLIRPTDGFVSVDGRRLGKEIDFPPSMGLMIENPAFLPNYTGLKNLELLAGIRQKVTRQEIRQAIADVGLDPDDKRKFRKYSLGMKKRLGIASAIMEGSDLILLDEPTNALDDSGVLQICDLLIRERNRGALVVVACHDTKILDNIADEVYAVQAGSVEKRTSP